jgi:hypothetical protein
MSFRCLLALSRYVVVVGLAATHRTTANSQPTSESNSLANDLQQC